MPIPIELLPSELNERTLSRGVTIFGSPGDYFHRIASHYEGVRWWFSKKGLMMEAVPEVEPRVPPFDYEAGKLMCEAREKRLKTNRLPDSEYEKIAESLDRQSFKLSEELQGKFKKELALWNQKNSKNPIRRFAQIFEPRCSSSLRRGLLRRLYRAEERFDRTQQLSRKTFGTFP